MSLPISIPVTARPTLTGNRFTATWNVPTVARYDFTNVVANQNQTVAVMTGSSVYIIERVCFGMTIPEGVFQESIDDTISLPQIIFKTLKSGVQIIDRPLPFVNYLDNLEILIYVPSNQQNDEIQVSFECMLIQVPATVGIVTIKAFLQLNIYEVQCTEWINRFQSKYGVGLSGCNEGVFG